MTIEILFALTLFAFASSITPGPNNLMLMSSGANFGFKLTMPHMLGVAIGFTVMIVLVGVGIVAIFDAVPVSYQILQWLSIIYLLHLALRIGTSGSVTEQATSEAKPFTFLQAALFQWLNPKAWTMALTAISLYAPSKEVIAVLMVALVFGTINLPCIYSWVVLGQKIQQFLTSNKRLRIFNITMAGLLLLSLLPTLLS